MEGVLYAVAEPVPTFDKAVVAEWAKRRLAPECEVHAHTTVVAAGRREKT
jgi:hypothetical protein